MSSMNHEITKIRSAAAAAAAAVTLSPSPDALSFVAQYARLHGLRIQTPAVPAPEKKIESLVKIGFLPKLEDLRPKAEELRQKADPLTPEGSSTVQALFCGGAAYIKLR